MSYSYFNYALLSDVGPAATSDELDFIGDSATGTNKDLTSLPADAGTGPEPKANNPLEPEKASDRTEEKAEKVEIEAPP